MTDEKCKVSINGELILKVGKRKFIRVIKEG
jgi:hypothetical protein